MPKTRATSAFGTLLQRGDGGSPESYTTIPECRNIDGPTSSQETIDATHHESPGSYREVLPTFISPGEVTFDMNYLPWQPIQKALISDHQSRTLRNFQIIYPDSARSGCRFSGYIELQPHAPFDERLSASGTIKIQGAIEYF